MRIFWIGIALCLSVGHVQGMEEEEAGVKLKVFHVEDHKDAMRVARHVVRSVVLETLETYVNKSASVNLSDWVSFQWQIQDQENTDMLNASILKYLKTQKDPVFLGCQNSFEGVSEALLKAGIRLDEQDQNKLRLLTPKEQHDEIISGVRATVFSIVYENVNAYKNNLIIVEKNKNKKLKINKKFDLFYDNIQAESNKEKLDLDIITYLYSNNDPRYFECSFSFKGIKEALKKDEIVLNNLTRTLRFLTEKEKRIKNEECQKLIDEFEEI